MAFVCLGCGETVADEDERIEHLLQEHDPTDALFMEVESR